MADQPNAKPNAKAKPSAKSAPAPTVDNRTAMVIGGVVLAIIVIAALVAIVSTQKTKKAAPVAKPVSRSAAAQTIAQATSVPSSVFEAVGKGNAAFQVAPGKARVDKVDGKPLFLYVGAEFCPYCAAERWAMVTALSRFGTFSNLSVSHSSSTDVFPNTPTFSFHGSTYTSKYLAFAGVETQTNTPDSTGRYPDLDKLTKKQVAIFATDNTAGSFPFVDINGVFVSVGATYEPSVLAGKTALEIAKALHDPSSAIAKGAIGSANVLTAMICINTADQPGAVCKGAAIQELEKTFKQ